MVFRCCWRFRRREGRSLPIMACSDLLATLQQALSLQIAGDLAGAEMLYRNVLAVDPMQADGCYLLGQLCRQTNRPDEAFALLRRAIERVPDRAAFHIASGDALSEAGRPAEAVEAYRAALDLQPDAVEALYGLGCALVELDALDEALAPLQTAVALAPGHGLAQAALGELALRCGNFADAEAYLRAARAAGADSAELANDLGVALNHLHRLDEAASEFLHALEFRPDYPEAAMNLGNARKEEGNIAGARECYARVLIRKPSDCLRIRMATLLPPVYASIEELLASRARFEAGIDELLDEKLAACDPITQGGAHNFYLCYQGLNDRDLQIKLARLYRKVYAPTHRTAPMPAVSGKIRIGFISAFFTDHTIGHLNQGIVAGLDRNRFEIFVFSVGRHDDAVARSIAACADHYHAFGERRLQEAESVIAQCGLHVLFYTDIGMEPFTYFLAFSRLAPVQCTTWGHPVTTGIDTIDYYISSVHQEPDGADAHYSERLVRLQTLPAYFYRAKAPMQVRDRASFGLSDSSRLYVCPQSLFKFHPDFDQLIGGILAADPLAELLIPEGHRPNWTEALRRRFSQTLAEGVARVRWIPRQGYDDYLQLMLQCDVMLDPLHFGGGKTTLDALSLGVPVVTLPGGFMRGRATLACYRQMDVAGCIAQDPADYVRRALELAGDAGRRAQLSPMLRERATALCERWDTVRELEQFFESAVEAVGEE